MTTSDMPLALLQPNPETLEAFAEVECGSLETVSLEELRQELRTENEAPTKNRLVGRPLPDALERAMGIEPTS